MNRVAGRAAIALVLVLALLAGFVFFLCEYAMKAGDWVIFPGSPHVYSGGNIGCGVIVDRDNVLLLDLSGDRTYSSAEEIRKATVHWLGDRNGSISAPALSTYSAELAGFDLLNGVYSYGKTGGVAYLTLSSQVQTVALEALGGRKGTVGIYNYKTGELLCAVTTPTYDPDNIPDIADDESGLYEGLYINRFTQSVYTPGSIFKIVTLAAALETIPDITEQKFVCKGSYQIGSEKVTCDGVHWDQDLKKAFRNSCNCAFAQIAQQLGAETLDRYVKQFGVTQSVYFDGINTASGSFVAATQSELDLAWSSVGQYKDLVNPCVFMTFVGAIANGGKGVDPYLVEKIASDGITSYSAETIKGERLMTTKTANTIAEYMGFNVTDKYGSEHFPGLTVCAKTGTAEVGGDKKPNAMIAGFVADDQYPLAFVVAVEDGGYGSEICVPILSKVLEACKTVIDSE